MKPKAIFVINKSCNIKRSVLKVKIKRVEKGIRWVVYLGVQAGFD
jgi:hypothetical protein